MYMIRYTAFYRRPAGRWCVPEGMLVKFELNTISCCVIIIYVSENQNKANILKCLFMMNKYHILCMANL